VTPGGGATCSRDLVAFVDSAPIKAMSDVIGAPIAAFLSGYCASGGNIGEAGRRTACDLRQTCTVAAIVYPIAAVLVLPAAPFLIGMAPVMGALAVVFDDICKGKQPSLDSIARAASGLAGVASPGDAATLDAAAGAVAAVADEMGKVIPAFNAPLPAESAPKLDERRRREAIRQIKVRRSRASMRAAAKAAARSQGKYQKGSPSTPTTGASESSVVPLALGALLVKVLVFS